MNIVKKIIISIVLLTGLLLLVKEKEMTYRQSVLKAFYGVLMLPNKLFNIPKSIQANSNNIKPKTSIYTIPITTNNGATITLEQYKGKKILIVNTASDCGYTSQYEELEKLSGLYKEKLVVIAFPANDFKNQESKTDEAIAQFCKINYGVTFPLMKKTQVVKGTQQNPLFYWLSSSSANGWNNQEPTWNFCKYLINEEGTLTHFFKNTISPLDKKVIETIE